MERLLHYVWKNRLMPTSGIKTTTNADVEILSVGLHNKDAGPDFFSADVVIGGDDWMGNVEIHTRSSDWYRHGHDRDKAYNNVILHVVEEADCEVKTELGRTVPQLVVKVPEFVISHYEQLQAYEDFPPCYRYAAQVAPFVRSRWMQRLCEERLERKAADVAERLRYCEHNWEHAFFVTMARAFGFGVNGDAFEQWARIIPYSGAAKHRDNMLQIEALFYGQAGFLDGDDAHRELLAQALPGRSYSALQKEYTFMSGKFSLTPMDAHCWRLLRTRPQNFPTMRLAQLASLYGKGRLSLSSAVEATTLDELRSMMDDAELTPTMSNLLILNGVVPSVYAYGRYRDSKKLRDKSLAWLGQLPAENNKHTRQWQQTGLPLESAADSQAVVQLITRYCARHDCLRCQYGYQYIKSQRD